MIVVIRLIAILIALIVGGVAWAITSELAGPLPQAVYGGGASVDAALLLLAIPLLLAALLAGLLGGLAGGAIARAGGIAGGLIIGAAIFLANALVSTSGFDTNPTTLQRLAVPLAQGLLAVFGAWVGETIATLITESVVDKLERRRQIERLKRL